MTIVNKMLVMALVAVSAVLVWEFNQNKNLKNKVATGEQNKAALLDSVRVMRTKNGELESAKFALAGKKGELEKLAADLAKELEKEKGKVRYISKVEVVYKKDTCFIPTTVTVNDSGVGTIRTDMENECRLLKGYTSFVVSNGQVVNPKFFIERDEFNLRLITGLRQRNKKLEIFVRSPCPGVSIQDIQGAVIDPNDPLIKPKKAFVTWWDALKFSGGIAVGIGVGSLLHRQ